ncbi:MAG TPA: response regulator [Bryobacteraceae bacterium]|nr:response regulator [Bryobacteraceae bacterium]
MDARILVVDDDPDIHALLQTSLRETGCRADCVSSGLEALARLRDGSYDLVLSDVCMPGIDGLELLRRIQQQCPSIPVLVMTARNTPETLIRSIRERAFGYFSKPFSPDAVIDMVRRALESPAHEDDIEVLSARPGWIALKLRSKVATADRLAHFFREMQIGLTEDEQHEIAFAFRELLMNAVEHGGRLDPDKKVEVAYIRLSQAVLYLIRDPGQGFSFENLAHAAVANAPGDPAGHIAARAAAGMRPGGFGIFMTRNIADELIYNEKGNEVILVKYIPARAAE